jgi:geranylgeranyl reductase family protein
MSPPMRIVIVGAGPAGATAALALARQHRHEVVLLDRDEFPRVKTCGSGLSPLCIGLSRALGLHDTLAKSAYGICGLKFTGPAGHTATLAGKEGAWVLPRAIFDATIAGAAERSGARFEQGFKVKGLLTDPAGRVRGVDGGGREIEADLVLCADGAHSRFSVDPRPKRTIATIMGWYEGVPVTPGHMEMWFVRRVSPWYGWLFPETPTRVNIGLCYHPDDPASPYDIFDELAERHVGDRLRSATRLGRLRGAPISYTDSVGPVTRPGALYLGEAARLTNGFTGEGIFYAMKSGVMAADLIAKHRGPALEHEYQRAVARAFNLRFQLALGFRSFRGSHAFTAVTALLALKPVERALHWALLHAT